MTRQLLLSAFAFIPFIASSQTIGSDPARPGINPFRDDQNARNIVNKQDDLTADGTPFLHDEFIPMEVTLVQGGVFTGVKIKLNIVDNEILFTTESGKVMATATPVKRLRYNRLKDDGSSTEEIILESSGAAINTPGTPVYQVLVDGKARLLKRITINYSDVRKYPEGVMARVFKKKMTYFAVVNGGAPVKIEKNKSDVLAVLSDKKAEVSGFIEKQKIKFRTESELATVFLYYCTL